MASEFYSAKRGELEMRIQVLSGVVAGRSMCGNRDAKVPLKLAKLAPIGADWGSCRKLMEIEGWKVSHD